MLKTMNFSVISAAIAIALFFGATAAGAASPVSPSSIIETLPGSTTATLVHGRYYREWDEDEYEGPDGHDEGYYEAPYDYEAPRVYRYAPPPPAGYYEPPVYGWLSPPRPQSCGKYRYWTGDYCADARRQPPYVGPRW